MPCNLFGRHGSIMTKDLSLWSLLAPQLNKTIKELPESTFTHIKGMLVKKIPDSSYYVNPKELYTLDQSKECKQFIIKMLETLGRRSLLCIGI